jgi:3-hydroxyisobutyrate dehydrogenase
MSKKLAFIGLGNMGNPMALNLIKAGYSVKAYDIRSQAAETVVAAGATHSSSAQEAARGVDAVITMLPSGAGVRDVYLGTGGVIAAADRGALLIDSSTIDVETARTVSEAAEGAGMEMVDAPVSGGVAGAENAALTFNESVVL